MALFEHGLWSLQSFSAPVPASSTGNPFLGSVISAYATGFGSAAGRSSLQAKLKWALSYGEAV